MTWNYRVVHRLVNADHIYAIHEAYYDGNKPTSITEESVRPRGRTPEELARDCKNYLKAIEHPVLEYADFQAQPNVGQ